LFGVRRPVRFEPPPAGDYEAVIHMEHPESHSFLEQYLDSQPAPEPRLGGKPRETTEPPDGVDG
jgi:hypothetical protein